MTRFKFRLLFTVGLWLFGCANGFSSEVLFTRLSVNDGLLSNFVNCVWQDPKGFLWVGTENGLQRYDGSKFIKMSGTSPDKTIPTLPVDAIVGDRQGQMWVQMGNIIGQYDIATNNFIKALLMVKGERLKLSMDSKGHVLATEEGGVLVYHPNHNAFETDPAVIACPADWNVISITEDVKQGNFWVSGRRGLGYYDCARKQFYDRLHNPLHMPLLNLITSADIMRVSIDSHGRYWVTQWPPAGLTLNLYDPVSGKLAPEDIDENEHIYKDLVGLVDANQLIWAYGVNLLKVYEDESKRFYTFYDPNNASYGIRFNTIKQVYTDHDQNIWVASDNGLYKATVIHNGISHGNLYIGGNNLTFAREISGHRLVFGIWGGGIHSVTLNAEERLGPNPGLEADIYRGVPADYSPFKAPWGMLEYSMDHHLILACQKGRLIDYDPLSKRSQFLIPPIFKEHTIRQIVEDRYHTLWFALQDGRLIARPYRGDYEVVRTYPAMLFKLLIDKQGRLWVGNSVSGIEVIDPGTRRTIKIYNHLPHNSIVDIAQINDSLFAVAPTINLDMININSGRIKSYTPDEGLPQPKVYSVQADTGGKLWLSTNRGIVRFDPKTGEFRSYDQKDGLITTTNFFNLLDASSRLKSGSLIFSGGNSYVLFKPGALLNLQTPKDVTITDIKLFDTFVRVDSVLKKGGLTLSHDQNSITVMFASLSYAQRNRLTYYIMLEGGGKTWTRAESNIATFTLLPPGRYTFKIKCVNSEGLASRRVTELKIEIRPAFWQTWWFLLGMIVIAAVPVYIIYRLRINRLVAVQRLREKVARDLHDDMGSTLTSINILSEMAAGKITADNSDAREYMNKISANSNQMMDAMDDIVWSIKPDNDTMPRIVARMREYAATVLEPKDISYTLTSDERINNIKLDMEKRRSLFLIFKEALNNLVKYSGADKVEIEFLVHHSKLQIIIKDNGVGFDTHTVKTGNGLANMRNRAQAMQGSLVLFSRPGQGTFVTLDIPIKL